MKLTHQEAIDKLNQVLEEFESLHGAGVDLKIDNAIERILAEHGVFRGVVYEV